MSYPVAAQTLDSSYAALFRSETGVGSDPSGRLAEILDVIGREIGRDLTAARAAAHQLVRLLAEYAPTESALSRGGLAPWQRQKIERYLAEHLELQIHVETLAGKVPLSVSHFGRAFKETFGETPHSYIMRLRLERAQQLMLATDEPLSQIAFACGFADQAHLSKLFRRRTGISPNRWRRLLSGRAAAGASGPGATGSDS